MMSVFTAVKTERNEGEWEEADEHKDEDDPCERANDEFRKGVHEFSTTITSSFIAGERRCWFRSGDNNYSWIRLSAGKNHILQLFHIDDSWLSEWHKWGWRNFVVVFRGSHC